MATRYIAVRTARPNEVPACLYDHTTVERNLGVNDYGSTGLILHAATTHETDDAAVAALA